ncbi:molybdopterin converting factor subunit 1 [Sphingomonas sp. CJ99]
MRSLHILYFAWVREAVGRGEERLAVPEGVTSIDALIDHLTTVSPGHATAFADRSRIRAAIDQAFTPIDAPLGTAREVAFFPPVTGG